MEKTEIVGFEGLHRCGKGTQIEIYSEKLKEKGIWFKIRKGDGARKGLGNELQDPISNWWKINSTNLYALDDLSINQKLNRINFAYQRLNREISIDMMKKLDVLILDRTFISRFFVMRQYISNISLEDSLIVYNPKSNKCVPIYIPSRTYVFHVDKQTLLERCERSEDILEKKEFRKKNIIEHYDLFLRILDEVLRTNLRYSIKIINGLKDPKEIHKEIMQKEELI